MSGNAKGNDSSWEIYAKLAGRLNHGDSERLHKILEHMISPSEGRLLLETPAWPAELALKLGWAEEDVICQIDSLLQRGLIHHLRKGYSFPENAIGLHDTVLSSADQYLDPIVIELWRDWYEAEWSHRLAEYFHHREPPSSRIIPAQKALEESHQLAVSEILPEESPRQIIEQASCIAVRICPCRRMNQKCDAPLYTCLQFGRAAENALKRAGSRELSVVEALDITERCAEAGLVHVVPIYGAPSRIFAMCNCCSCCCLGMNSRKRHAHRDTVPSRYKASIDPEACTGCQICVKQCPFNAIHKQQVPGSKKLKAFVETERCAGCGVCVLRCRPSAISLQMVRPAPELVKRMG